MTAVTDLASASAAIELIVEQGEGARGDWVNSHFGRLVGILEDLIADPLKRRVADLFNAVYEVILQVQSRYFVHHGRGTTSSRRWPKPPST